MTDRKTSRICELNDTFRSTFAGGRVVITAGIDGFPPTEKSAIIAKVRAFDDFSAKNDPYGEHDFGSFSFGGHVIFWKIDYYGRSFDCGSEDPSDPAQTTRVMTIMLAEEY